MSTFVAAAALHSLVEHKREADGKLAAYFEQQHHAAWLLWCKALKKLEQFVKNMPRDNSLCPFIQYTLSGCC